MLVEVHTKGISSTDALHGVMHRRRRQVLARFGGMLQRAKLELHTGAETNHYQCRFQLELLDGQVVRVDARSNTLTRCINAAFRKAAREARNALHDSIALGVNVPVRRPPWRQARVVVY